MCLFLGDHRRAIANTYILGSETELWTDRSALRSPRTDTELLSSQKVKSIYSGSKYRKPRHQRLTMATTPSQFWTGRLEMKDPLHWRRAQYKTPYWNRISFLALGKKNTEREPEHFGIFLLQLSPASSPVLSSHLMTKRDCKLTATHLRVSSELWVARWIWRWDERRQPTPFGECS